MIKVLHIGKYYHPFSGGIENFMVSLLPATQGDEFEVSVLAHHHESGKSFAEEQVDGIRVFKCPIQGVFFYAPVSLFFYQYLKRVIKQVGPDVLHIHMPNVSPFWLLVMGTAGNIPMIIHWHSDVLSTINRGKMELMYRLYRPFEQALLRKSRAIIVTSPNYLASSIPLAPWRNKCRVIPLALENAHPARDRDDKVGKPADQPTRFGILAVGRLTYYKGHSYLIEAMKTLDGVNLVIAGKGDEYDRLHSLIDVNGLEHSIDLKGYVPEAELADLIANCDCLCLPSIERTEAFGLVLLEAMRAGKPCIVTDVEGSGMNWVVQHDVTGLVVHAADEESLREAIAWLRDNPQRRRVMGEEGKKRFIEHFGIEAIANQVKALYREVGHDD